MTAPRQYGRVLLDAHITGPAAAWLVRRPEIDTQAADAVRYYLSIGRPELARAISAAMAQLRECSRAWLDEQETAAPSVAGSAETAEPETAPRSDRVLLLTPAAAAQLLNVTSRRVRQLLVDGSLAGTRMAGRWLVDRESVEEFQTRRSLTA